MATARKCDRCKKLYEHYAVKVKNLEWLRNVNGFTYTFRTEEGKPHTEPCLDLCPECLESLVAWWDGGADSETD